VTGTAREPLDLADIQGLVARGYGRLPHATYLLLRVDDPVATGRLLRRWVDDGDVTPASQSAHRRALHIALTAPGVQAMTGWDALPDGFSEPFLTGMATPYRSRLLGDVGANDPAGWRWGGPGTEPVHLAVLVYADQEEHLAERQAAVLDDADAHGLRLVEVLGTDPVSDREPFGFPDGVSQPILAGLPAARRGGDVVRDGEFVLGYVNEYDQRTERPLLDRREDPDRLLPRDVDGSGAADLGRNGSYLVFRQLRQDVAAFEDYLTRAAGADGGADGDAGGDADARERLAAKLVGRWRGTGAPLVLSPSYDDPAAARANGFGYHDLDPDGLRCPIGAHARRANPRDSLPPGPGTPDSRAVNRRHRLVRRGRSYSATTSGAEERGLHFQCLSTSLARQYEFVQHTWLNDPSFDALVDGEDPLVGPRVHGPAGFTVPDTPVRRRYADLPQFVTVRGGGYFFLPGLRALRYLSSGTKGATTWTRRDR
jgi:Dyp-type peroxidase family